MKTVFSARQGNNIIYQKKKKKQTLTIIDRMEVVSLFADQLQHVGELRPAEMPRRVPRKIDDRRAAYVAGQQHYYHQCYC